jgi:hypothetical protein
VFAEFARNVIGDANPTPPFTVTDRFDDVVFENIQNAPCSA